MLISSSKQLLCEEERVLFFGGEGADKEKLTSECTQCAKERKTPHGWFYINAIGKIILIIFI